MIYESSYESGRIPFVPDVNRGHWSNINDFIFASLGLSYRMDIFVLLKHFSKKASIISFLPAFAISLTLYIVPLLVVQSFMGQFSSSGFISAFRISPIFKGIGYVSLTLNVLVLIFYSPFAMIPLVYMIGSFNPQLPWGCDGVYSQLNFCNPEMKSNETEDYLDYDDHIQIPSYAYFQAIFHNFNFFGFETNLSRPLIISAIFIWILMAIVTLKFKNMSNMGQILRYAVGLVIGVLIVLIVRLSFESGIGKVFSKIFTPNWRDFIDGMKIIPNYGISAFGPGWGIILTLASFNKFNTNIRYTSWLIGGGHMLMIFLYSILEILVENCIISLEDFHRHQKPYLDLYLTGGSVFAPMKWANLWSVTFYFMLVVAGLTLMIIQLNVILCSIFDEFITLRKNRAKVTLVFIGLMAIFSLYFVTEHAYESIVFLKWDTLITQSLIDLLMILAVLWVYGRQRFQRDLEFMINERFATWKIFVLRFLAPIVLLITLIEGLVLSIFYRIFGGNSIAVFNLLLRPLPWLCVPGYAVYCLVKSKGSFTTRFLKSARPTDWYPVAVEDRYKYEDVVNNANMTHPLNILEDDENI